ncbi:hypothetical protein AB835_07035 [Candidatus Endobugula sertula]|uniref:Ricin B lectin domain-containing protein n=1 Tax=Candidatus Endobugula sertula TaxID=62101 RepID=A0A1D2QQE1_9GAMM|nr:hypothetical protein AB835_07035 [Candidatus Endobugula sertula]
MYLGVNTSFDITSKESWGHTFSKRNIFVMLGMLCAFMLSMVSITAQAQQSDTYFWSRMKNPTKIAINSEMVKEMYANQFYPVRIHSQDRNCGLQWGKAINEHEREAKFDCNNQGDDLLLKITKKIEGTLEIEGQLYSIQSHTDRLCGLQWGKVVNDAGYNERNAKFDCGDEEASFIKIVNSSRDTFVIRTEGPTKGGSCGLQWESRSDENNERNAKFDCNIDGDVMKIFRLKDNLE